MARDPNLQAHLEWLGYLQPVGLVVSPHALLAAGAYLDRDIANTHRKFLDWVEERPVSADGDDEPLLTDLLGILTDPEVFGWQASDILGSPGQPPVPESLEVALPEYHETLRPTYAIPEYKPAEGHPPWILLIQELPPGTPLDKGVSEDDRHWQASPQARFERLLRETGVPIGLLFNGTNLRLVYAPRGETAGHVTFPVLAMYEVAGRPIFSALHLLLSGWRLFSASEKERLPALLAESRKYQNLVSTRLAGQILDALYELLRGFQAANDRAKGELLRDVLRGDPDNIYSGLLTILLRLIFTLYAEDRALLSEDPVYLNHYSVNGLFARLRVDNGRFPDTMDQRYGAWAQLLTLFRLIYDGGRHGAFRIPPRRGYLFEPNRYPFLEGRETGQTEIAANRIDPPMVSDGVVFRVLEKLLVLDGERLSYRSLDVEQIGSVYEAMMGFHLGVAAGRSIAIRPAKSHGAPVVIDLDELLSIKSEQRAKWLKDRTDQSVTGSVLDGLQKAMTTEEAVAALERKVARNATPAIVSTGGMILQPSDERRKTGSHYTPRALTEPIVRTTLKPVLERLGENPKPEQILSLKVCDPAMGSGAFLVEACRQLGDALVSSWRRHDSLPILPPDEDELLHARRLIADRKSVV